MKTETWKPMKYLAGLLALILVVTCMPVSTHAAEELTGTQEVTVQHEYDITAQGHSSQKGEMKADGDALNGHAFRIAYAGNGSSADLKSHFQLSSSTFCRVYYSKGGTQAAIPDSKMLVDDGAYHLYPLVWTSLPNPGTDAVYALNICSSQHAKADGAATAVYKMQKCSSGVYLSMKLEGTYSSDNDAYTAYWFDKIVIEATHTLEEYTYEAATCGSDATITGTCTTCSQTVTGTPEGYTRPDHTYSDYVSDGNGNAVATCSGCGATDTITDAPVFHSASISTKGNIAVNYYTKLPTSVLNSDATVTFTVGDDTTEIPVSEGTKTTLGGLPYYVFSCQVPAKQMTDTITATCGDVTAAEFSVRAYADIILNGSYSDGLKSLVTSMLHYGAYAQQHFVHNTGSLADAGLDAAELSSVTAETLNAYASTSVGPDGAKFYGCSLILESETTLRFFFKVSEGAALTVNDGALEVKTRGDYQYVDITNISAKDLGTPITLTVSDGANTAEVTASPLTYCYNVLSVESAYDAKLVELVKSLYLYYVQAAAYFN